MRRSTSASAHCLTCAWRRRRGRQALTGFLLGGALALGTQLSIVARVVGCNSMSYLPATEHLYKGRGDRLEACALRSGAALCSGIQAGNHSKRLAS